MPECRIRPTVATVDDRVALVVVGGIVEFDNRSGAIKRSGVVDHEAPRPRHFARDKEGLVGPVGRDVARGIEGDRATDRARDRPTHTRSHDGPVPGAAVGGSWAAGILPITHAVEHNGIGDVERRRIEMEARPRRDVDRPRTQRCRGAVGADAVAAHAAVVLPDGHKPGGDSRATGIGVAGGEGQPTETGFLQPACSRDRAGESRGAAVGADGERRVLIDELHQSASVVRKRSERGTLGAARKHDRGGAGTAVAERDRSHHCAVDVDGERDAVIDDDRVARGRSAAGTGASGDLAPIHVGGDHDLRSNHVGHRATGVLVIPGCVGERPGVAIDPGIGVAGGCQIEIGGKGFLIDARRRAGGPVRLAVVGHQIGCDQDLRHSLLDRAGHRAAGVLVIPRRVGERPEVAVVDPGIGAVRGGEIETGGKVFVVNTGRRTESHV